MNAPATHLRRGWCPSVHRPMAAADGLLLRVKPRLGRLDAAAARRLAAASEAFGNGRIDLTSRGNLQFRGFHADGAAAFATAAIACGAADADPPFERRRNVLVSPLADIAAPAAFEMAASLQAALDAAPDLDSLPDKFCFAVEAGGGVPIGRDADIRLVGRGNDWQVGAADECSAVTTADPVAVALALARVFARRAARHDCRRMRGLVAVLGAGAVYTVAGLPAGAWRGSPVPVTGLPVGVMTCASASGQLEAGQLRVAADLATKFGDGVLRFAPWRAILIAGVAVPDMPRLALAAGAA